MDWRDYHQKRKHELETFLKAAKTMVSQVGPPRPEPAEGARRGRGWPGYHSAGMLLLNLIRMRFRMSYRDLESFAAVSGELRQEVGLASVPGRDTIHGHAQALSEAYFQRFNEALTERLRKTNSAPSSTPRVSRSKSTRGVGALPRTRNAATRAAG